MMRIAIELDEVIRSKWLKFDESYVKEFGEENISEDIDEGNITEYDYRKYYKFDAVNEVIPMLRKDLPEDVNELDYIIDEESGKALVDDIIITDSEEHKLTSDDVYKRFLYQDYVQDIYAFAPVLYRNAEIDVQRFIKMYKDAFRLILMSEENIATIPHTLFFLSKCISKFKEYKFLDKDDNWWEHADIIITHNPKIIESKPDGKLAVKINRKWNIDIEADFAADQLADLVENEDFHKLIDFKNEE
jgi:hypothetical protein